MQLCELYSYEKGVRLFKNFVENIEDFKDTLSDQNMIKFIKSGLNKSYGYFMLKNNEEKHKLCATLSEFQNLLETNDVIDFDTINERYLDVSFQSKSPPSTNCYSNLSLGVHILAYSRMIMDQKVTLMKEKFKSMKVFLLNVDAIAFSLKIDDDFSLLKLDRDRIGAFKMEIKDVREILSFQALSPHSFNFTYLSKSGHLKNLSKVCGFSLQSLMNSESINQETFKHFISEALNDKETSIPTTQVKHFSNGNSNLVQRKILQCQLKNTLFKKRVIKDAHLTLPFGYTENI